MATYNTGQQNYPRNLFIAQLVARQAAITPDKVALVMGNQSLTYQELNERANQLAHYLQAQGIRPDVPVGICIERSLDMVVGLLGILKAGGAYMPLDPSHPMERIHFMLHDAQAPLLVTKQHIAEHFSHQSQRIVCLDGDAEILAKMMKDDPFSEVTADDVAYVMYTSGSTGQPKGVQIRHRSLLNLVFWHQQNFEVTAVDRATQFASPAFDVMAEELWPHLTSGASVYLFDEETRFDPLAMRTWLVNCGITITILPTALVENLIALEWPTTTALRVMLTGGDILYRYPPSTLPFAIINNYGPTETTVVATSGRIFPDEHATVPPSIGRPVANTQIYLLDENLQKVPTGKPGELYIGGAGLAKGYLNRPDLTAEKFIADPFSPEPQARLYRTGDVVRHLADGTLEFLGRLDHQVKIRGFRIELGEIETLLSQHPAVRQAVVVAREDVPGNKRLVAFLVPHDEQPIVINTVRRFLQEKLPEYMLPSAFVQLEALPLTSNGKVDRQALSAPDANYLPLEGNFVAPRTPVEEMLAITWSQLLGIEQVGIHDNFFMLGGYSLLAMQVISRVRTTLQVEVPLRSFFEAPTIAQLAETITRLKGQGGISRKLTPRNRSREGYRLPVPSTSSQKSTRSS